MTQKENGLLSSGAVDKLATLVEEATRATKDSPRRFIEPARGTLDRVPMAFIDLEAFKGHTYPDVLLSVLIETMNAFDS